VNDSPGHALVELNGDSRDSDINHGAGDDEEGTVEKSIKSRLLLPFLLGKMDVPNQFYDMKERAGMFV